MQVRGLGLGCWVGACFTSIVQSWRRAFHELIGLRRCSKKFCVIAALMRGSSATTSKGLACSGVESFLFLDSASWHISSSTLLLTPIADSADLRAE